MITRDQLAAMLPDAAAAGRVDLWFPLLTREMGASQITTDVRIAAFLASTANETGGLQAVEEGGYFNTPDARIMGVFKGISGLSPALLAQWRGLGQAAFDVAFFNHVYADANRPVGYKLGNVKPGDGYRYRGMGPNQLTGRGNYAWMQAETGIPLVDNPEMIKTPDVGAKIAAHFWRKNGCNKLVDSGTRAAFLDAMRKLNAGLSDFSHHLAYWERAKAALAGELSALEQRAEDIRALQEALLKNGFDPKGIDGQLGPNTRKALRAFEKANGFEADGIVDAAVLKALGLKTK